MIRAWGCVVKTYYIYILANFKRTLYAGVTSNMAKRMWQHRNKAMPGFANKYNIDRLVYCETTLDPLVAIAREKQIKSWTREKKIALIETRNPYWKDLSKDFGLL